MTERDVVARGLWAYRSLGWRLDAVWEVCRGPVTFRRFELRAPDARRGVWTGRHEVRWIEAPLKAVAS